MQWLRVHLERKAIAFLVRRQCDARLSLTLSAAAIKIRRAQSGITTMISALGHELPSPAGVPNLGSTFGTGHYSAARLSLARCRIEEFRTSF
jgi:hypothetical protein